jgi:hypothetical protein
VTVSGKSPTDLDLMLYADGELEGDAARVVGEYLAQSAEARKKVEALAQVGEAVRTYLELEADTLDDAPDAADVWPAIARGLGVNGQREAVPASVPDRAAASVGFFTRVVRFFDLHRGHVLTGLVSAGAVAGLMLFLRPPGHIVERVNGTAPTPPQVAVVHEDKEPAQTLVSSGPPEVEDLEVHDGSGMVLTLPSDDGDDSAATVIWISADESSVEGPL